MENRYSKQRGEPEADVDRKWDNILNCRWEASRLINEEIKRKGTQWLSEVNKKEKIS